MVKPLFLNVFEWQVVGSLKSDLSPAMIANMAFMSPVQLFAIFFVCINPFVGPVNEPDGFRFISTTHQVQPTHLPPT